MSRTRTERVSTSVEQDTRPRSTTRRRPARQQHTHTTTTATTPSQTLLNNVPFTYSEFLGNLSFDQPAYSGAPRFSNATTDAYRTYPFDSFGPGPSRIGDRSNPTFIPQDFIVDNGWSMEVEELSQGLRYTRIEEVDEDVEDEGVVLDSTPRPRNAAGKALNGGRHPRNDYDSASRGTYTASSSKPTAAQAAMHDSRSRSVLDEFTEVELVRENNTLLDSALEDVKFMNTFFLSKSNEYEVSQHIDYCTEIEKSLKSLLNTLRKRLEISSEEWNVRSEAWYQKYCKRILALRITLQRLIRMRQLIETHTFRPRQQSVVLSKLEQHEAKLADLTSKFTMAFDRLTLCHVHYLLSKSHKEAQELLQQRARKLTSKASFERKWDMGKQFRASLREAFQDIHPLIYNNSQQSRRSTDGP